MRKPRDFDSELRALNDKAKQLRARRLDQLGELVIVCGADALSIEQLAGALLEAMAASPATKEGWRKRGALFFRTRDKAGRGADDHTGEPQASGSAAQPDAAQSSTERQA